MLPENRSKSQLDAHIVCQFKYTTHLKVWIFQQLLIIALHGASRKQASMLALSAQLSNEENILVKLILAIPRETLRSVFDMRELGCKTKE